MEKNLFYTRDREWTTCQVYLRLLYYGNFRTRIHVCKTTDRNRLNHLDTQLMR